MADSVKRTVWWCLAPTKSTHLHIHMYTKWKIYSNELLWSWFSSCVPLHFQFICKLQYSNYSTCEDTVVTFPFNIHSTSSFCYEHILFFFLYRYFTFSTSPSAFSLVFSFFFWTWKLVFKFNFFLWTATDSVAVEMISYDEYYEWNRILIRDGIKGKKIVLLNSFPESQTLQLQYVTFTHIKWIPT